MSELYHVARPDGTQYGQMGKAEIQAKLASGALPADTLVWKEGMADWASVYTICPMMTPPPVPGSNRWGVLSALKSVYIDRYCNFEGRAGRPEYWFSTLGFYLLLLLAALPAVGLAVLADDDISYTPLCVGYLLLCRIILVLTIIPNIAVSVRRLHDIGLSGWFALGFFIPWAGYLFTLICGLIPSAAPNKWGNGPEGPAVQ